MTDAMFKELQAIIGMANETNKLVTAIRSKSTSASSPSSAITFIFFFFLAASLPNRCSHPQTLREILTCPHGQVFPL